MLAGPALAASAARGRPPAVQSVLDCRKIDDGAGRLACFDAAVAAMERAESSGDLVTVDRAQRRAARHQAFGLALPSLAFLDRGEKPEEVNRITARVVGASFNPYGKLIVKLDDGAVWRQIDDNAVDRPPHTGSTAEIRRASLGSYTMKPDGQFAIRVHRDN
ncbi:MAG: hypothetical protein ACR2FH_02570 [Caulobacteraceae bacterium]